VTIFIIIELGGGLAQAELDTYRADLGIAGPVDRGRRYRGEERSRR
jgi:hypothetical protein